MSTNPKDRKTLLSNILKECNTVEDFESLFTQKLNLYNSLPERINTFPKLVNITPWCIYLKDYIRNNKSENSKCDIKRLSKEASIEWRNGGSKVSFYSEKAQEENEYNLQVWRHAYSKNKFTIHENMCLLKSEDYICSLKKQELIHLIGCIGMAPEYTQVDCKLKKMRNDLCMYFRLCS